MYQFFAIFVSAPQWWNYVPTNINIHLPLIIWNKFFSLWKIRKKYSLIIVILFDCVQLIMYQYCKFKAIQTIN